MTIEMFLVGLVAVLSFANSIFIYSLAKHIERLYKRIG
jgi:hypothetical protein